MSDARTLVVENDPTDDVRLLGDWLTDAGLHLEVVRPHAGDLLPDDLSDYAGLVVLGGGLPDTSWYEREQSLLRTAGRQRIPTLALCLGAQLLALAFGGYVERAAAGPELGPKLVAKRDAAGTDPLFADVPLMPDVIAFHHDEITELPEGATLLAASPSYPHQAFRYGDRMWALQFHIECDRDMLAGWIADSTDVAEAGLDREALLTQCVRALPDVAETWRPFAQRFADLVTGRSSARTSLPLLEG
ncbi:type 1 glutamine amidotransferase [Actinocatenispora thailandica]|uniref:type 1 glutamine amidotransferase n=1 Tax=Actinocatenispora thailandica TaxID=227318 RepID=UPI001EF29381|nr:type 1 glutamine amidotransferase [Actinocatenispora thailandica]